MNITTNDKLVTVTDTYRFDDEFINELRTMIREQGHELETVKRERDELASQLRIVRREFEELTDEFIDADDDARAFRHMYDELDNEFQELEDRCAHVFFERDNLSAENRRLRAENERLRAQSLNPFHR